MTTEKLTNNVTSSQKLWGGYEGKPSIFDEMTPEDLILAFFPCTRFEVQIIMGFRGEMFQQKTQSNEKKLEYAMKLHEELHENYKLITMLAIIVERKGLRMVFENPYSSQHYLTRYWPIKPAIIDHDRTQNGDYYKKPTQYWFFGFKPYQNLVFEALDYVPRKSIEKLFHDKESEDYKRERSEIHPQYASRFIRQFLIPQKGC